MPRGLKTRAIAIWVGAVVMAVVLHVTDMSADTGGSVIILYTFVTAIYFGYFIAKHGDEIPTRSKRD